SLSLEEQSSSITFDSGDRDDDGLVIGVMYDCSIRFQLWRKASREGVRSGEIGGRYARQGHVTVAHAHLESMIVGDPHRVIARFERISPVRGLSDLRTATDKSLWHLQNRQTATGSLSGALPQILKSRFVDDSPAIDAGVRQLKSVATSVQLICAGGE